MVSCHVRAGGKTCSKDHRVDGGPTEGIEGREWARPRGLGMLMREGGGHGGEGVEQFEVALCDGAVGGCGLHHGNSRHASGL